MCIRIVGRLKAVMEDILCAKTRKSEQSENPTRIDGLGIYYSFYVPIQETNLHKKTGCNI